MAGVPVARENWACPRLARHYTEQFCMFFLLPDVGKASKEAGMNPREVAAALDMPSDQLSRLVVGQEEPNKATRWAFNQISSTA